jgi:hypothetical protein
MTIKARPARSWFVAPKRGHRIKPPLPSPFGPGIRATIPPKIKATAVAI